MRWFIGISTLVLAVWIMLLVTFVVICNFDPNNDNYFKMVKQVHHWCQMTLAPEGEKTNGK